MSMEGLFDLLAYTLLITKKILPVNIVFKLSDANNKMSINAETPFQSKYFKKWYGYNTFGVNITADILKN